MPSEIFQFEMVPNDVKKERKATVSFIDRSAYLTHDHRTVLQQSASPLM